MCESWLLVKAHKSKRDATRSRRSRSGIERQIHWTVTLCSAASRFAEPSSRGVYARDGDTAGSEVDALTTFAASQVEDSSPAQHESADLLREPQGCFAPDLTVRSPSDTHAPMGFACSYPARACGRESSVPSACLARSVLSWTFTARPSIASARSSPRLRTRP